MMKSNSLSRSEQIRQRRSARGKSTASRQKSNRKSLNRKKPPVLVRGDVPIISMVSPKKRSRARRRYDIALSMPGAELRLPSLPRVRFGWRAISFCMVVFLGLALYFIWNSPEFRVNQVQIDGLQRLTSGEINALLDVKDQIIFALDKEEIYGTIKEKFPEFSSINVSIDLPNEVRVKVVERIPVLVWYENGRTLWVDEEGYAFPSREDVEPPDFKINAAGPPQIFLGVEPDPNQLLSPDFITASLQIREIAPEGQQLLYSVENGLGWQDKKGWEVYLGTDMSEIEMKLEVYDSIKKHLKKNNITPNLVSVEMLHAPFYRLEP